MAGLEIGVVTALCEGLYLTKCAENLTEWLTPVVCADRTTLTHNRRLERVLEHLERDLQRGVEPGDVIPPYTTWHQQRRVASFDFRVSVYRENLWVNSLPIIGRPRDISPDHLRCVWD